MKLTSSPRERIQTVTLGLVAHKSGPNILLGIFLGALIQTLAPSQAWWTVASFFVWVLSVVFFAVADEVQSAIQEKKNRLLEPESRYYGIE